MDWNNTLKTRGTVLRNSRLTKINPAVITWEKRCNHQQNFEKNFLLLNIYLWIHLLGFEDGFKWKRKYMVKNAVSVIFAAIGLGSSFIFILRYFLSHYKSEGLSKESIVLLLLFIVDALGRFLLYRNRKKLKIINKRLVNIWCTATENNMKSFRTVPALMFLLNDIITVGAIVTIRMSAWPFPNPLDFAFIVAYTLIFQWTLCSMLTPVYFCWYCHILKRTLVEIKRILHRSNPKLEVHSLHSMYEKIFDLIYYINKTFYLEWLLVFFLLLMWIFHHSYIIIFREVHGINIKVFHILRVITCYISFSLMCMFSSSLSNTASEIKDILFNIPCELTSFVIHVQRKFSGFTLFGSIAIDNVLIIMCTGILFTYGLMLATFNSNSKL